MLLAIDTATRVLSLALHDGRQICAEMTWMTQNQHTVELMPAISEILEKERIARTALRLLAVSQGPGSFNGLRIGFSAAKGLAMALKLPLLTIPTLDVIAAAQPNFTGTLIAVVQAGRGRVCKESYRWEIESNQWVGLGDIEIVPWQTIVEQVVSETVISGEIDPEGYTIIERSGKPARIASPAFSLRRAGFLAELAWEQWRQALRQEPHEAIGDPDKAVPFYLHQPGVPHP
jgi:tRNA threonylcarbamoyladenosine biosynthesis protein TsaB